jgi:acyl carrier protein
LKFDGGSMEDKFLDIVANVFRIKKEELNMNLQKDDIETWDSLAHIALVAELEEELGIEVPIEDVPNIKKLKDFERYFINN